MIAQRLFVAWILGLEVDPIIKTTIDRPHGEENPQRADA